MGVMHPLAIVTTASITSLVRMTLYHHSISVYHARVETDEDMVVFGWKGPERRCRERRHPTCERHSRRAEEE
jgi:hypothetical protein